MNRTVTILTVLLIAQIGLAVLLKSSDTIFGGATAEKKLLAGDFNSITKIVLEEKGSPPLVIEKKQQGWILPGYFGFPASKEAVNRLLDDLKGLNRGWPVATTADAAPRFKVSSDDYVEKILLSNGDSPLFTLYVGSSSGYHKVYVRVDKDNEINSCEIPPQQLSTKTEDWFDRSAAEVKREDIVSVELPQFKLERKDNEIVLTQNGRATSLDPLAANQFLDDPASINISSVLSQEEKPEYQLNKPDFSYAVQLKNGSKITYNFSKLAGTNFYVLKASNLNFYIKVDSWFVDRIKETTTASLIEKSELLRKAKEKSTQSAATGKASKGNRK